eukprot:Gb_04087 [translate_table: standard]
MFVAIPSIFSLTIRFACSSSNRQGLGESIKVPKIGRVFLIPWTLISDEKSSNVENLRRRLTTPLTSTPTPSTAAAAGVRALRFNGSGGDAMGFQEPLAVKAERGFLSMYTSKNEKTRYNKLSASDQVMCEVRRLVEMYRYREEELSITITGHSLGGALGLLNAYEMAAKGVNRSRNGRDIPITVFSFGAPRVGNMAFRDRLNELGVKTLRVVSEQDMVPKMPGILLNEGMDKLQAAVAQMVESSSTPFRPEAKRDVALVNKSSDLLLKEVMIPANWYQLQHKGLVRNCYGRWVQPERDAEDVPSPKHVQISCSSLGFDI